MWYLSGAPQPDALTLPNVGFMLTPAMGNNPSLDGVTWAADNGRFSAPERYTDSWFMDWLKKHKGKGHCLFACAPDVLGDPVATWNMSEPMFAP